MQQTLNSAQSSCIFCEFCITDYGFWAVFGCPAHDQRDFDFAKKNLEIKTVVRPSDENENYKVKNEVYPGPGVIINWII